MLTSQQIQDANRLLDGIDRISDAVNRLNDLASAIPGLAPMSLRFGNSARIYGEFEYHATVNRIIANTYRQRVCILAHAEPERLAA